MHKVNVENLFFVLLAAAGCVLYMPIRAFLEMGAATGAFSEELVARNFLLIRGVTPFVTLSLVFYFLHSWGYKYSRGLISCVLFYFAICFAYVFLGGGAAYDKNGINVQAYNLGFLFTHLLCLGLGVFLRRVLKFKKTILVLWAGMILQVVSNFDVALMSLAIGELDSEKFGVYLLYGDTFVVWSLIATAALRGSYIRALVFLVSLAVSFVLYSRTSFFALVMVSPFLLIGLPKTFRFSVLLIALASLIYGAVSVGSQLSEHRMLEFLFAGNDGSLYYRQLQAEVGIKSLLSSWVFGDYAGQVRDFGEVGAYIHSFVSYWQQFGIFVFCIVVYLLLRCAKEWFFVFKKRSLWASEQPALFLYLFPVVAFEIIFSRAYVYPYFWLLIGTLFAQVRFIRQNCVGKTSFSS